MSKDTNYTKLLIFSLTVIVPSLLPLTILFQQTFPQIISYIISSTTVLIFLIYSFYRHEVRLTIPRWSLYLVSIVYLIFIYHLILNASTPIFLRSTTFIIFSIIFLFYIPDVLSEKEFFLSISLVFTLLSLIALPTIVAGSYSLGILEVGIRGCPPSPLGCAGRGTGIFFRPTSIFDNPNTLGFTSMVGFVSAVGLYILSRLKLLMIAIISNTLTLVFANSRMAIAGAVVGILSIASVYILDKKLVKIITILSAGGIAVFIAIVSGILPDLFITNSIDLSNRGVIWSGIVEALLQQPLLGYGPGTGADIIDNYSVVRAGPHNSFLRLYLISGVIGGCAYVLLILVALIRSVPDQLSPGKVVLYPVLVMIIIRHVFSGETIFGINALSVTAAIIIGYGIKRSTPSN